MTAVELVVCIRFSVLYVLNKRINIEIEIIVFKHSSFYLLLSVSSTLPLPLCQYKCLLQWTYHFLLHHHSVWPLLHDYANICFLVVFIHQTLTRLVVGKKRVSNIEHVTRIMWLRQQYRMLCCYRHN